MDQHITPRNNCASRESSSDGQVGASAPRQSSLIHSTPSRTKRTYCTMDYLLVLSLAMLLRLLDD